MAFRIFDGLPIQFLRIPAEVRARFNDESLCRRCGLCCHSGITYKGKMILLKDLPCKHLEYEPGGLAECTIYERRVETGFCNEVSVKNVARGLFPADCPYVKGIKNYSGKIMPTKQEFKKMLPALKRSFRNYPMPEYINPDKWDRFLYEVLGLPRP